MYLTGFPSYNALKNYEHMRPGHCGDGYYRGWDDDEDHTIMDAEKCAMLCDKEPECVYFAVKPMNTCSRYKSSAGECQMDGDEDDHELYKKRGTYTLHHVQCSSQILTVFLAADMLLKLVF